MSSSPQRSGVEYPSLASWESLWATGMGRTCGRGGFTLLEMMLALALFAVGSIAGITLIQRAQAATASSENTLIATQLAQRCMEQLRNVAFGSLDSTLESTTCANPSGYSRFTPDVTVTLLTSTTPYNSSDLKRIKVQGSWATQGGTANVTLHTLRSNK